MRTTLQAVSIALDAIYQNSKRAKDLQLPKVKLVKESGVGLPTFNKLMDALIARKLIFVIGATRSQYTEWNKEKVGMNPTLVKSLYHELYVKEEVRPRQRKVVKLQYDEIVAYLRSRGWHGTLERVKETEGIIRDVQYLDI